MQGNDFYACHIVGRVHTMDEINFVATCPQYQSFPFKRKHLIGILMREAFLDKTYLELRSNDQTSNPNIDTALWSLHAEAPVRFLKVNGVWGRHSWKPWGLWSTG